MKTIPSDTIFRWSTLALLTILLWNFSQASLASIDPKQQSHASIQEAVHTFLLHQTADLAQKITIEVARLDHRLRLSRCGEALETFSPPSAKKQGKTTVGVRCAKPNPWTLYVSANIGVTGSIVAAKRDIARGQAITLDDVVLVERDLNHQLRGYFDSLDQVVGRTLKRAIRRDRVVTPNLLVVQKTVRRGEEVTILAGSGSIQVRVKGRALSNGNPGDLIKVQNLASKKKLEVRILSAGLVKAD
ncbi:MAG: flagellar basal body P-ring formation protein FlgA [gamma proteobacterium endosymbiont of Lamellibrachia anaximandri]|nr:flagellar basal body P-ring formation protein FlgA [gamma proteobacterium endosymbiont of Lamellibrachia anaximandri]MBL3534533.1 flagellar basal body P-ring formation protein FlgA [gamma proteobacterium endosymbiont of Lamellibrachia anaximandri]